MNDTIQTVIDLTRDVLDKARRGRLSIILKKKGELI